jgi:hypothetical protein
MNYKKLIIIMGILLFINGCTDFLMICSLNPFYLEKDVVMSANIEGRWNASAMDTNMDNKTNSVWQIADTSFWQVQQFVFQEKIKTKQGKDSTIFKPQKFYIVKLLNGQNDSTQYQFKLVLFRIHNSLYGDFSPYEVQAIKNSRIAKENYLTVHTLARIDIKNKQLFVAWLGSDYMKDMIERKRVRIKYRYIHEAQRLLLTASSEELTQMIEKYGDQTRFIDWKEQPAQLKLTRLIQLP